MADILHDTNAWVALSFIIFAFIVYKKGKPAILRMLDARIESIRNEIASAEALRLEAQELLAQYQRKHRDAMQEAKKIIENAQAQAAQIRKEAEADLAESMERKEKQLKDRVARLEQGAIAEIQKYAAELAIQATAEIITGKLDKKASDRLVDQAIKDLPSNIN
jgi:F-type H+-transporting ATPase subunit b